MKTLVKGTDTQLIARWIAAMEKDIEKDEFYSEKDSKPDYLYVTSLNKARLSIMSDIFRIASNDNNESSWRGINSHSSKKSIDESHKTMLAYFETMKELLEIKKNLRRKNYEK